MMSAMEPSERHMGKATVPEGSVEHQTMTGVLGGGPRQGAGTEAQPETSNAPTILGPAHSPILTGLNPCW